MEFWKNLHGGGIVFASVRLPILGTTQCVAVLDEHTLTLGITFRLQGLVTGLCTVRRVIATLQTVLSVADFRLLSWNDFSEIGVWLKNKKDERVAFCRQRSSYSSDESFIMKSLQNRAMRSKGF